LAALRANLFKIFNGLRHRRTSPNVFKKLTVILGGPIYLTSLGKIFKISLKSQIGVENEDSDLSHFYTG